MRNEVRNYVGHAQKPMAVDSQGWLVDRLRHTQLSIGLLSTD